MKEIFITIVVIKQEIFIAHLIKKMDPTLYTFLIDRPNKIKNNLLHISMWKRCYSHF